MQIERIRLVDSVDEETPLTGGDFPSVGRIELKVNHALEIPIDHPIKGTTKRLASFQEVKIVGTNSVPPINGHWYIENIDYDNNTFLLSETYNIGTSPDWADIEDAAGRDISIATGKNAAGEVRGRLVNGVYQWEGFTNGTTGYVIFSPSVNEGTSGMKMVITLPDAMASTDSSGEV